MFASALLDSVSSGVGGRRPALGSKRRRLLPASVARRGAGVELAVAVVVFAVYSAASLLRFARYGAGIDLGLFGQAVRGYASGTMPWSSLKAGAGFNLLGDHFSPIVAVLAPLYYLWPHIQLLLLAQAALIAWATFVVTRLAHQTFDRPGAACVGFAFGFGWGISALALFDFHEVAFALPLLASSLVAARDGRWRKAVCWALPLMLVKEDSAFLLFGIAIYAFVAGQRRLGVWLATCSVASFGLLTLVIIPHLSFYGRYTYWAAAGTGGSNSVTASVGVVVANLRHAFTGGQAMLVLLLLLGTCLLLPLRSPMIVVVVPSLLARFATANSSYWGPHFQYNATIMVVAFVAALDAISRGLGVPGTAVWRRHRHVPVLMLVAAVVTLAWSPLRPYLSASEYKCETCRAAGEALAIVPSGVTVAASTDLVDHLVDRDQVQLLETDLLDSTGRPIDARWVVMELGGADSGMSISAAEATLSSLEGRGYVPISNIGGYVVLTAVSGDG
ncbi:MAG TPA: DUF2079 domain-containing protein [Jatrophihabitantaceae bacterium]|jgi:uncharacterized membrane protein|nr:DUF2079 domain-containing protein [Jatrophihabitantaceae bacterium]